MEFKLIKVFSFKELKKDIKEKVLNRYRNDTGFNSLNDDVLSDTLTENLKDELNTNKIETLKDLKLYYDFFGRGGGLCFVGQFKFKYNNKDYISYISHNSNYYYNESVTITITDNDTCEELENTDKAFLFFKDIYQDITRQLLKDGHGQLTYFCSDEYIKEHITINEYQFLEDGRDFNY